MTTVAHNGITHRLPTPADRATDALYGHVNDTLQAWHTACREAAETLPAGHDPERVRKALRLAQDGAVTLHTLGLGGSVRSGPRDYRVLPDGQGCDCPDAQHRSHACKHALAVHLHRGALARLGAVAAAPSTPSPSPQPPQPPASGPASAHWDVHEAPISSCFRYRVGAMEWTHTIRGATDAEVQARLMDFVSTFREVVAGLDALHAERDAAPTPAPSAPPAAAADDQASGVCSLHQVPMDLHSDPSTGDTWRSHYDAASGRYCKGQRARRRPRC